MKTEFSLFFTTCIITKMCYNGKYLIYLHTIPQKYDMEDER